MATTDPSDRGIHQLSARRVPGVFALGVVLAVGADIAICGTLAAQAGAGVDTTSLVTGSTFRDCPSCPQMIVVPEGTFIMGSPESEKGRLRAVYDLEGTAVRWTVIDELELEVEEGQRLVIVEGPQRYVTIEVPFAVGVYEVTFDEWDACARSGGCGGLIPDNGGWGRGRRPVINVNWDDANAYAPFVWSEYGTRLTLWDSRSATKLRCSIGSAGSSFPTENFRRMLNTPIRRCPSTTSERLSTLCFGTRPRSHQARL